MICCCCFDDGGVQVFRLGTEEQVPYRMAVHPRGDGVLCAFPNGCRLVRWESPEGDNPHSLVLRSDQEALVKLNDVGLQLAVSFSGEGSILATGGEDGHLRVFKWPGMETVIEEPDAETSVKDLSFSSDEMFLVVNRSSGPSRVWDLKSSEAVANLPREQVSDFFVCQFALVYFLCLKCTSDSYISREKYLASADFLLSLTIVRFSLLQQCKVITAK
uniref:Anaphase-promoting complex subunit 4-like WD40 domain-containing protein n=1 Tax=Aegilops tauschii subsp. strangulata TaxID=200361 RepID=A0A453I1I6_AEGTS